eukprot:gene19330-25981_t
MAAQGTWADARTVPAADATAMGTDPGADARTVPAADATAMGAWVTWADARTVPAADATAMAELLSPVTAATALGGTVAAADSTAI